MIRRRVFENAGEDATGAFYRCEGDAGCERWQSAAGETHEAKTQNACSGCPKNCSPPLESLESGVASLEAEFDAAVAELVERIEYLATWEHAGRATDWSEYPFEYQKLFVIWRDAERQIEQIHAGRVQAYIKAKFQTPE